MALPTPQLLTVDALIKIKQSPRVTALRQQQKEAQELKVRTLDDWFEVLKAVADPGFLNGGSPTLFYLQIFPKT